MGNMTKIPTVMVFKQNGDNALSLSWKCDFFFGDDVSFTNCTSYFSFSTNDDHNRN